MSGPGRVVSPQRSGSGQWASTSKSSRITDSPAAPKAVQPHIHALYTFMRYADEIVDNPGVRTLEEQLAGLEVLEEETLAAVAGEAPSNAMLQAFANTVLARTIEPDLIVTFMRSMKMDTHVFRYPTYEDLDEYIYGSAAVVGLMMHRGVGVTDVAANLHAEALGVAMQLTNFLRDVREE